MTLVTETLLESPPINKSPPPLTFRVSPINIPVCHYAGCCCFFPPVHSIAYYAIPPKTAGTEEIEHLQWFQLQPVLFDRLTAAQPDSWSGWKGRLGWRRNHQVLYCPGDAHGPSLLSTSPPGFAGRLLGFACRSPSASRRRCLKGRSGAQNGGSCCLWIRNPVLSKAIKWSVLSSKPTNNDLEAE